MHLCILAKAIVKVSDVTVTQIFRQLVALARKLVCLVPFDGTKYNYCQNAWFWSKRFKH